jgi:murein L,D-transpeptidase YafK
MSKEQDFSVGVANMVLFGIFMIEILMNIKTEGYFCSFYFYLDLISTVTLLLDVDIITDALFNQSSSSSFQVNTLIAKSKASRAAARAVRVVKIFRLARVAKLYKSTQKARELNEERKKEVKISLDKKKHGGSEQKETANQG